MNDLLDLVVDQKSSDLHLQVGVPPCLLSVVKYRGGGPESFASRSARLR